MARILVVDDSPTQALEIQHMLEQAGFEVETAGNGREAITAIRRQAPKLVLTDLQMPEMDGLQLVGAIRRDHPAISVILMTAYGNEEVAVEALRKGAASYVPKKNLARDLIETVDQILEVTTAQVDSQRVLDCLEQADAYYVLDNDPSLVAPLIGHLEKDLLKMRLCDQTGLIQVCVALREALSNAIYHGNLEVSSDLRHQNEEAYYQLAEERRGLGPHQKRQVHVTARFTPADATFVIRDEGPGFDVDALPDPTDPANMEKASGRGLLLIRTFMDKVFHNDSGNQITMVKRRNGKGTES